MNEVSKHYHSEFRKQFIKKIKNIIIISCGRYRGENFKLHSPIIELIDYKNRFTSDGEKFQLYVTVITDMIEDLTACFSRVDFSNINLNWTSQQVIDLIMDVYDPPTKEE